MDIARVGGNVDYLRPIGEYKKFIPMKGLHMNKQGLQTLGFRVAGIVSSPDSRARNGDHRPSRPVNVLQRGRARAGAECQQILPEQLTS